MNWNSLKLIISSEEEDLFDICHRYLLYYYGQEQVYKEPNRNYILAKGDSPVCLVAHLDTVWKYPPRKMSRSGLFKHILKGSHGLGADDRAGVYAILNLIETGASPSVIFTTGEERGGIGALKLIQDFPTCPFLVHFLIELDRRGKHDSVYYDCKNEEFMNFINSFGFKTAKDGIYSDITFISPVWGCASVNLSVGYKNEHTKRESLNTKFLDLTIEKVNDIIESKTKDYVFSERS